MARLTWKPPNIEVRQPAPPPLVHHPPKLGSGIRDGALCDVLKDEPAWKPEVARRHQPTGDGRVRFVIQSDEVTGEVRFDQPRADSFHARKFYPRYVRTTFEPVSGRDSDA